MAVLGLPAEDSVESDRSQRNGNQSCVARSFGTEETVHQIDSIHMPRSKRKRRVPREFLLETAQIIGLYLPQAPQRQVRLETAGLVTDAPGFRFCLHPRTKIRQRRNISADADPNHTRVPAFWKAAKPFSPQTERGKRRAEAFDRDLDPTNNCCGDGTNKFECEMNLFRSGPSHEREDGFQGLLNGGDFLNYLRRRIQRDKNPHRLPR